MFLDGGDVDNIREKLQGPQPCSCNQKDENGDWPPAARMSKR